MHSSNVITVDSSTHVSAQASESLLTALSSTFGTSFQLWRPECCLSAEVTTAVERARRTGSATLAVDRDHTRIWIALPGRRSNPPLAIGTMTSRDPQLLHLLIRAACKLITQDRTLSEQSADVASCLESLTYGLEEQTWLRSLTSHLTLCSLSHTWLNVANAILPSLRALVRADSLTILTHVGGPSAIAIDSSRMTTLQILRDGEQIVGDSSWQDWLEARRANQDAQSLVQNGPRVDATLQSHGVHALCAVPIVHRDQHFGWIAAVKLQPTEIEESPRLSLRLSEEEFGTIEAGLIEAAASMLATHRNNVDLLQDRENLTIGVIRAMGNAIDARDPYTRGHSERVGRYGRTLARAIGLPQIDCDRLYLSGLLHDVGKIGIPDTVLRKPGKLTDEEFAIIQQHPEIGAKIVSALPQLADLLPGVLHHHENMDGTGYPHGLVGESIPLMGRILAVADAYDAMTSNRPYRAGMPRARAIDILSTNAGIQWDEHLIKAFLAIPIEQLMLDAVDGADGWNTDEVSLRGGSAALFGKDLPEKTTSIGRDNAVSADGFAALPS